MNGILTNPIRKINASLHSKMLVLIGVVAILLIALLYALSQIILMDSFVRLEEQESDEDTRRVINALQSKLADLHILGADWSNWDDTYQFVQDRNPAYVESNLGDETFASLRINLILLMDSSGQLAYGKAYRLDENVGIPLTPSLMNLYLSADDFLAQYSNMADSTGYLDGLVLTPAGAMMITAQPVVRSDGSGEPTGKLFMGRYLDEEQIESLIHLTSVTLDIRYLNDPALPPILRSPLSTCRVNMPFSASRWTAVPSPGIPWSTT